MVYLSQSYLPINYKYNEQKIHGTIIYHIVKNIKNHHKLVVTFSFFKTFNIINNQAIAYIKWSLPITPQLNNYYYHHLQHYNRFVTIFSRITEDYCVNSKWWNYFSGSHKNTWQINVLFLIVLQIFPFFLMVIKLVLQQ